MRKKPDDSSNADRAPAAEPRTDAPARIATYRLLIEYDGSRYSGWQEQKNARTVAGALLHALADTGFPVRELGGAGRTDAGVHALAQCAHLRLEQRVDPGELRRALNRRLPYDIHVLTAAAVAPEFHARHDAALRSYVYQLSRRRTALAKPRVWWVRDALDLDLLREAAARIVGRHDFRHFADVDSRAPGASTQVEVERVEIEEDGALVLIRITASHFLWKMVRRLVGTLVQVTSGQLAADDFARLLAGTSLAAEDPRPAQWTAPPSGLFLERVHYPGDPPPGPLRAVTPVPAAPRLPGEAGDGERAAPPRRRRAPARKPPGDRRGRRRPPGPAAGGTRPPAAAGTDPAGKPRSRRDGRPGGRPPTGRPDGRKGGRAGGSKRGRPGGGRGGRKR